jgi:hypothetical protein
MLIARHTSPMTISNDDRPPTAEDNKNRYLRETMKHLAKLQRIVETQRPGEQSPVQGQFDELIRQFDVVHTALIERGFLPMDDVLAARADPPRKR